MVFVPYGMGLWGCVFRHEPARLDAVNGCATEPALPPELADFVREAVEGWAIFKAHATGLSIEARGPVFKNFLLPRSQGKFGIVSDRDSQVFGT